MGFLNQSLAQLRDLFSSMTPAARITSALLLGVIVVSLGYLFQGYSGGAEELLFGGELLQPSEANAAEAAIASAGLDVLDRQSGRIVVPRGQKTAYLAAIADGNALPANFDKLLDESLDGGLLESGEKGKQRYKAARERQISMFISAMDGVADAKVLYDILEPKAFEQRRVTATVSVRPAGSEGLTSIRMKMIREAVASAIGGLEPGKVTILDLSSGSEYGGGADVAAESFDDLYWQTRTKVEQTMKARVEDLLRYIPGIRVQVSAELDPMLGGERRIVRSDGDPATVRESTSEQKSLTTQVDDRGRPGPAASGPNGAPPETAVAKNENSDGTEKRETENFVPTTEEMSTQSGLAPKKVSATIAVPSDYIARVWRETTKPSPAADATPDPTLITKIQDDVRSNIQKAVTKLFPLEVGDSPYPGVEVTFFQSLTPDPVEPPSMANEGLLWARANSGSLIMGGLALMSLVMLRSMVRSIPAPDPNLALSPPMLAAGTALEPTSVAKPRPAASAGAAAGEKPRQKLRLKKGPTLKDDLTEMVREDPDGAAAILRNWIGNAS